MTRAAIRASFASIALASVPLFACVDRDAAFVAHAPLASPAASICPLGGCIATATNGSIGDPALTKSSCASSADCDDAATRACDAHRPERCTARALDVWAARGPAHSLGDVIALFDRACALGDLDGCYYSGRLLLDGRGVARDRSRGVQLLEQACDDGHLRACETLARKQLGEPDGQSGVASKARTRRELQARCLRNDSNSCFYVALYFDQGSSGFPKDPKRGAIAYARGCDLGDFVACNNLANDYYYGDGVTLDLARAAQLYERACRDGLPIGCANVGFIAEYGDGVPLDMKRATEMYASGCSGASAYACLHAEMVGEYRRGTPHDPAKAVDKWRRACDGGSMPACTWLGVMYEDGKGVGRDEARALALMKKACAAKNPQGCAWMREHGGTQ